MAILAVTAKGQLTLRKHVLARLGIKPGDKVEFDMLRDGKVALAVTKPAGDMRDFVGLLACKLRKTASLRKMDEAIAQGWAGRG